MSSSEPTIADNKPVMAELTAGEEYHWCACGRSSNQPFCDGSHVGTDFAPVGFVPDSDGEAALCACPDFGGSGGVLRCRRAVTWGFFDDVQVSARFVGATLA
jgi:hypothetical protein